MNGLWEIVESWTSSQTDKDWLENASVVNIWKSLSLITTLTAIESLSAPQTINDIDSLKT